MSSDSRGAKPRPHLAERAALARGKNGRRRSIALQGFAGRSRAAFVVILEGRPPCRPTYAGRSPAPIRPTKPRWRAGKMGADGASPSKVFDRRSRAAFVIKLEGRPPCRPTLCGAKPRPHPAERAALARGKSGRRRSIALQVFDRRCRAAFVIKLEGRPPCRPTLCGAKPRPHPAERATLARGKNGRRRSIALQGFR